MKITMSMLVLTLVVSLFVFVYSQLNEATLRHKIFRVLMAIIFSVLYLFVFIVNGISLESYSVFLAILVSFIILVYSRFFSGKWVTVNIVVIIFLNLLYVLSINKFYYNKQGVFFTTFKESNIKGICKQKIEFEKYLFNIPEEYIKKGEKKYTDDRFSLFYKKDESNTITITNSNSNNKYTYLKTFEKRLKEKYGFFNIAYRYFHFGNDIIVNYYISERDSTKIFNLATNKKDIRYVFVFKDNSLNFVILIKSAINNDIAVEIIESMTEVK